MSRAIDEQTRRNVIQQWFSGFSRDTIAAENNIGAGTVSSIVVNYKIGLEELEFDYLRQLSIEIRKQGLNWSDLAPHIRLHNFIRKSGAAEDKIESFIARVHSSNIPLESIIQCVNQLYDVSQEESIPLDQVSGYIKEKLQEKQKIEEEIKEADAILQSKNVNIEAINEHIQLKEIFQRSYFKHTYGFQMLVML